MLTSRERAALRRRRRLSVHLNEERVEPFGEDGVPFEARDVHVR
jgi:hypothetical protein